MTWIIFAIGCVLAWGVVSAMNKKWNHLGWAAICSAALLVGTLVSSLTIIESGEASTLREFGIVTNQDLGEGVYLIAPWKNANTNYSVRRNYVEFSDTSGNPLIALSKDPTEIQVDLLQPYQLHIGYFGNLYSKIGGPQTFQRTVLAKALASAVRDTSPKYGWKDAAALKKNQFAKDISVSFKSKVTASLINSGFTQKEVDSIITFHPLELRRARPTSDAIVNAVSDKLAELEELEKQETTTKISKEVAKRRTNEGKGISNLFGKLPKRYSPEQVSSVLHAMADKTRADAMMKAVSQDKTNLTLMAVPSTTAISVK